MAAGAYTQSEDAVGEVAGRPRAVAVRRRVAIRQTGGASSSGSTTIMGSGARDVPSSSVVAERRSSSPKRIRPEDGKY